MSRSGGAAAGEPRLQVGPPVSGHGTVEGLLAVSVPAADASRVRIYRRVGDRVCAEEAPFRPFLWTTSELAAECPAPCTANRLAGDAPLNTRLDFDNWAGLQQARAWLQKRSRRGASAPDAPFFVVGDPVQQFLLAGGDVSFRGLRFEHLRRMQVDIECRVTPGYEFCLAERPGDSIVAIGLSDSGGWRRILRETDAGEAAMLQEFVRQVRERDPDVIEGHNLCNFDLPYLAARARMHGVELAIGRDGSVPARRTSRLAMAERTISYERFDIDGRHVIDTFFLVQQYDVVHRNLPGFGLKEVARHFGLAASGRVYLDPGEIAACFAQDAERAERYLAGDLQECRDLGALLAPSAFAQAGILPFPYQDCALRGNAAKIEALLLREYLRRGLALPVPGMARAFAGGYTRVFLKGVVRSVHHCDVRSLYPSLMLAERIGPRADAAGVFHELLAALTRFRLEVKAAMKAAADESERRYHEALQSAFKVLINSFYGYLGFAMGRFSDFEAAAAVARRGREILARMIEVIRETGGTPVEIDTDGVYFTVGPGTATDTIARALATALPQGIEVEFDGFYEAMYSYKAKNYALRGPGGEVVLKGAAMKSRGLEPFLRDFLREIIALKLAGQAETIQSVRERYERDLLDRRMPVGRLARTETLQDSLAAYQEKIAKTRRGRSAAYELALASGREFRPGDTVTYYVTGLRKTVAVHAFARLASDWNPAAPDENVQYYLAKLHALYAKFAPGDETPVAVDEESEDGGDEDAE